MWLSSEFLYQLVPVWGGVGRIAGLKGTGPWFEGPNYFGMDPAPSDGG